MNLLLNLLISTALLNYSSSTLMSFNGGQNGKCTKYQIEGVCSQCPYRSVLISGSCVQVSGQCNTWDQKQGYCTSCYQGYTLVNRNCQIAPVQQQQVQHYGSSSQNLYGQQYWQNQHGKNEYSHQYQQNKYEQNQYGQNIWQKKQNQHSWQTQYVQNQYIKQNQSNREKWQYNQYGTNQYGQQKWKNKGKGQAYSPAYPQPAQNNYDSANCLAQDGYGKCISCPYRCYLTNGRCLPVSDQCQTWDERSGVCTCCYTGYTLKSGRCVL